MPHKNIENEIATVADILAAWPYLDGRSRASILEFPEIRFPTLHPIIKQLGDSQLKINKGEEFQAMSEIINSFTGDPSIKNALAIFYPGSHTKVENDIATKEPPYNIIYVQGSLMKNLRQYLADMYQMQKNDIVHGLLNKYDELKQVTDEMLALMKVYYIDLDSEPKTFKERIEMAKDPNTASKKYILGTGFSSLNQRINEGGLLPKRSTVVAARSGFGKTSFVLQLANYVALNECQDVLILSFEMGQQELMDRMLSQASRQPVSVLIPMLSGDTPKEIEELAERMDKYISIQYPGNTGEVMYIENQILDYIRIRGKSPALVVVDYIQQLTMGKIGTSRPDDLEAVSRALRGFGQQYNTHMVIASQITEDSAGNVKAYGARAIEFAADLTLFLDRNETDENKRVLRIKKNRHGPDNINIDLIWNAKITSFFEESAWDAAVAGITKELLATNPDESPTETELPEIDDTTLQDLDFGGGNGDLIPF